MAGRPDCAGLVTTDNEIGCGGNQNIRTRVSIDGLVSPSTQPSPGACVHRYLLLHSRGRQNDASLREAFEAFEKHRAAVGSSPEPGDYLTSEIERFELLVTTGTDLGPKPAFDPVTVLDGDPVCDEAFFEKWKKDLTSYLETKRKMNQADATRACCSFGPAVTSEDDSDRCDQISVPVQARI